MDAKKVYYVIGVSSSSPKAMGPIPPAAHVTYHVSELRKEDAEFLSFLRKMRDQSLEQLGILRLYPGSSDYNREFNQNVAARQRHYLGFLRSLDVNETGYLKSSKPYSKGEFIDTDVVTLGSEIYYVPTRSNP
jgi:hypothetical protein